MARTSRRIILITITVLFFGLVSSFCAVDAQSPHWTQKEQPIVDQLKRLRSLSNKVRAETTKQLARDIRKLPPTPNKLILAENLADLSTEGDFGHDTLQEVALTLAQSLKEISRPANGADPASAYVELAELAAHEHVDVSLDNPQFTQALARLKEDDEVRSHADFTLSDLQDKTWTLATLRGKVVLVNFWATWCQPCRKEMPDLEKLYRRSKDQGLVILGISDENAGTVKGLLGKLGVSYPILLDPGRKVNDLFRIEGIPKSFVYDREGKMVAEAIDMRTETQFLKMLAQAGLK
jgi:peroxiredoxin